MSTGLGQSITSDSIAGFGRGKHGRKEGRKIRRRRGVGGWNQLLNRFQMPGVKQNLDQADILTRVLVPCTKAAATAVRPIQCPDPSSEMANPQPPARAVWPLELRP